MNISETLVYDFLGLRVYSLMSIDQKSRASQLPCAEAGRGEYSLSDDRKAARHMPPGCDMVSGTGNFAYVVLLTSFVLYLTTALVYPTRIFSH